MRISRTNIDCSTLQITISTSIYESVILQIYIANTICAYCTSTINDMRAVERNKRCPVCGDFMIYREGKFGPFFSCRRLACSSRGNRCPYGHPSRRKLNFPRSDPPCDVLNVDMFVNANSLHELTGFASSGVTTFCLRESLLLKEKTIGSSQWLNNGRNRPRVWVWRNRSLGYSRPRRRRRVPTVLWSQHPPG